MEFIEFEDGMFGNIFDEGKAVTKINAPAMCNDFSQNTMIKQITIGDRYADDLFGSCSSSDEDNDEAPLCAKNIEIPETLASCDESKAKVGNSKSKVEVLNSNSGDLLNKLDMNKVPHNQRPENLPAWTGPTPDDENFCCICMEEQNRPKVLHRCSHSFCSDCIEDSFKVKPVCPVCFTAYDVIRGNQPQGSMNHSVSKASLPGYEGYGTIVVSYSFGNGVQTKDHPHPGVRYQGTHRTAYLPDNPEGRKVLRLLQESFKRKLTFTIGRSRTTGCDNVVTWNDIHHKTCTTGGQENFGYPDPTYLRRVQEELAAVGVTEASLNKS